MNTKEKQLKTPISHEKIYKIMFSVTFLVAIAFLIKNMIGNNPTGAITIGICLLVFGGAIFVMHLRKVASRTKELGISLSILVLTFLISLNSGASYSDDFPMFLAIIGMSGLYLEPLFTHIQIVLADILFVIMYIVHPQKAGDLSQYILCEVIFTLAAILFSLTIKRGRAFIELSNVRAREAERLLASMKEMGIDLEKDFSRSSANIDNNTKELQKGSSSIVQSASDITISCNGVQEQIQVSEHSIAELNDEVSRFEQTLTENKANMDTMSRQLSAVSATVFEANDVFRAMEKKMSEVADIAEQLSNISFNTTILSLNASIEAARAGEVGAGFDVVATEMRELSNNSNMFSEQVTDVVKEILSQVEETAVQFADSTKALAQSESNMQELKQSFERLTERFDSLYRNIATQNHSVNEVNTIFKDLKAKVLEMQDYSVDNQKSVAAIVEAMELYRININHVIESTRKTE